jgi:hypothetical protein
MRVEVPASKIPRIAPEFLEQERKALGESWFRQEYCCSFETLEGLVYPDFAGCLVDELPRHVSCILDSGALSPDCPGGVSGTAQYVGGVDFGFRNPFAAVWGYVDRDDVLWIVREHYQRQRPLSHHLASLPRLVNWYADPSGAAEIDELRSGGLCIRPANNALRNGIAAVSARIQNGTLKVLRPGCANLVAESELYRYGDHAGGDGREEPVSAHNHALDALRYLIVSLDARSLGRKKPEPPREKTREELEKEYQAWYWKVMNDDDDDSPYWSPAVTGYLPHVRPY